MPKITIPKEFEFCNFPDKLRTVDVTAVFKNGDKTALENYKPVSALPIE